MLKLVLPYKDSERFKTLKTCYLELQKQEDCLNIINEDNLLSLEKYYSIFEKIEIFNEFQKSEKEIFQKNYNELFQKAKLYFTHYYQSMYMAIERGELSSSIIDYYNMKFPFEIPNPKTAEQFIKMSESLFSCDELRVANGGKYFSNPSIGSVKVWFEKFNEVHDKKINKFNIKQAAIENINKIREESDSLIYNIYTILFNKFSYFEIDDKIEYLTKYGLSISKTENIEQLTTEENNIETQDEPKKKIVRKRKSKNQNQLQFNLFFPE